MKNLITPSPLSIPLFIVTSVCTAALVACGGGGSDDPAATTGPNSLAELQGTFAVACDGRVDTSGGLNKSHSNEYTIVVGDLIGTDRANVSVRARGYESPAGDTSGGSCTPSTLTADATATGQIRDLKTTKNYVDASGATVTGKAFEISFGGFTLSKGTLTGTLPAFGATAKLAYVLQGNKLYVTRGSLGADGLPDVLGPRAGVKQ